MSETKTPHLTDEEREEVKGALLALIAEVMIPSNFSGTLVDRLNAVSAAAIALSALSDEEPVKQRGSADSHEPVLSGRRREYVAKRLLMLVDECAGYGGDPVGRAYAAADAARALIELDDRTEQKEPAEADLTNHLPSRGA